MQSFRQNPFYSFRVDASALGGFLERAVPQGDTHGGAGVAAAGRRICHGPIAKSFDLDEIVSCSSAYSRVSGTEHHTDGSISI